MLENLLDPLSLFFLVGFGGGPLKSDLKLPDAVDQLLSTHLLLAIGLYARWVECLSARA